MGINIYDTYTMLEAVKVMRPRSTFLRDRYFPTGANDIFTTKSVLVDFVDEVGNRLAPAVMPHVGGIPIAREGYETEELTPPKLAPERVLTVDQLETRTAGENVFGGLTPQEREAAILRADLERLDDIIGNREEHMAAQTLLNNGYTLRQYADRYSEKYTEKTVNFYSGASNPAVYTPAEAWSVSSTRIIPDIAAMCEILTRRGLPATDLVVSGSVADVILGNEAILKLLDNRRFILAQEMNPSEQANGSTLIAVLNVKGHMVSVYAYTREYEDEDGTMKPYIPDGYCFVSAPSMGRTAYGAITQLEQGSDTHVTYAARRVPKVISDPRDNTRTLIEQSRPLVMPKTRNAAISARVIF